MRRLLAGICILLLVGFGPNPDVVLGRELSAEEVLKQAVTNLREAASFAVVAHDIRAYRIVDAAGEATLVYGEFNTSYAVIQQPTLQVYGVHEYRYDPQGDFSSYEVYTYQTGKQYFTRFIEDDVLGEPEEVLLQGADPIGGDVYQTLLNYADQAVFAGEEDGVALYTLAHPKWYTLQAGIGFADLGFLAM